MCQSGQREERGRMLAGMRGGGGKSGVERGRRQVEAERTRRRGRACWKPPAFAQGASDARLTRVGSRAPRGSLSCPSPGLAEGKSSFAPTFLQKRPSWAVCSVAQGI